MAAPNSPQPMRENNASTPARRAATLQDVALLTGVTPMTVSNALRGKGRVSVAVQRTVMRAAQQVNYLPNPLAQRLSIGFDAQHIDLCTLKFDESVGIQYLKIIQNALLARGYDAPLHSGEFSGTSARKARLQAELIRKLRSARPRAIVCSTLDLHAEVLGELEEYIRTGGQVVCYDDEIALACDNVIFDQESNIYTAARHLLELGHRRFGVFEHGAKEPRAAIRNGFERALKASKIRVQGAQYFGSLAWEENAGLELARHFLKLKSSARPTAMIVINDRAAFSFMTELARAGVLAPHDVSVIGEGDLPVAQLCSPLLSSISHPVSQVAEKVVDLLQERLSGEYSATPRRIVIEGELVLRASTASPLKNFAETARGS